jgi:hypothetical protein
MYNHHQNHWPPQYNTALDVLLKPDAIPAYHTGYKNIASKIP